MENYSHHQQMCEDQQHHHHHHHRQQQRATSFPPAANTSDQISSFHQLIQYGDSGQYCQSNYQGSAKSTEATSSHHHHLRFSYPSNLMREPHQQHHPTSDAQLVDHRMSMSIHGGNYHHQHLHQSGGRGGGGGAVERGRNGGGSGSDGGDVEALKAKIMAHPQYSHLLDAYLDCQKVGASPELASRLAAAKQVLEARQRSSSPPPSSRDPELDQFMEAYCNMLVKYKEELARPVQEAMDFMRRMESQLSLITNGHARVFTAADDRTEGVGSSEEEEEEEEEQGKGGGEAEVGDHQVGPRADQDRELKNHLLKKYSGYLSKLKQELSKKKKKGKLPKEARQKLLSWWELHCKWPYPSESEKVALAEATGLDQKQINNWFINQRKRHWKPSEDMQFMVMDGIHPQNAAAFYMGGHYMADGPYGYGT